MFLKKDKAIKIFTGQGIEKINDVVRSVYHSKSNRHDACKEAVQALKRIDNLQDFERKPHVYKKKDENYWSNEIFEQRRKRPRLCVDQREEQVELLNPDHVDTMTLQEVKEKLKELEIKTKARKIEKLKQLLKKAILEQSSTLS